VFAKQYAELYDLFHANKDYGKEVNQIIEVLGLVDVRGLSGFDLGCGTGAHASEFLKHGAHVDGFDISQDMLSMARKKSPSLRFSDDFQDFKENYDFTYSLFDVLSYQVTKEDALRLISQLFEKTKHGGSCLIDSWNSAGVQMDPPKINERTVSSSLGEITRRVTPDFEQATPSTYTLKIELLGKRSQKVLRTEIHLLRAWNPAEVFTMMQSVGFQELTLFNPSNPLVEFELDDWRFGIKGKRI
jgi:SAM-dependent methyltransferase